MDNVTEIREQYAEILAESYDKSAEGLHECARKWAEKQCYQEAHNAEQRAKFFTEIAWDLRRPKNIRLEMERYREL